MAQALDDAIFIKTENFNNMKTLFYAAAVCAALSFTACGGPNSAKNDGFSPSDSSGTSGDTSMSSMTNANMMDTASKMNDTSNTMSSVTTANTVNDKGVIEFVKKASSGGMMEVTLGKIAAQNAQSDRVKNFAAMIVSDHTAAGNELKSMASSNSIMVDPGMMPDHQKHVDMLKAKTGAAFDKAYMDMMVTDHK
ncbi:MAG: DUF4142 domain-containing protein, partial [Sphingobacteriales bacterium]